MEADVPSNKEIRKRTEDAAADRVMSGDSFSAQVDPDPVCLTGFGHDSTEPPALPCCRDDAPVDKGAEAPKPYLPPVMEVRMLPFAVGGQIPAGTASTAIRTFFPRPHVSWSFGEKTKKLNSRTNNQPALSGWRRSIQT